MENKRNNGNLTSPTTTTASPTPAFAPLKIVRNLSLKRMKGSSGFQEKVCLIVMHASSCLTHRQVTAAQCLRLNDQMLIVCEITLQPNTPSSLITPSLSVRHVSG